MPNQALFSLDHFRMYDGWLGAFDDGDAIVRLQINFLHNQGYNSALGDLANQLPELRERLKNQFPFFGNDMVRTGGIGEWAAPFAAPTNANGYAVWYEAQRLVAQAGWRNENSQAGVTNIQQIVETYEAMDAEFGITHLRWGLQHGDMATPEQLQRLKALNVGLSTSAFRWQSNPSASGAPVGPLFPQLVDSGINLAMHEDGVTSPRTTLGSGSTTPSPGSTGPASRSTRASRSAAANPSMPTPVAPPGTSTGRTSWGRSRRASGPISSSSTVTTSRCPKPT
jgi:hypothetical protein